ncbi:MAG: hypothetical protein EP330_05780 [Deltaproteobacteria bacterium]|nr:MAG: hypothetical protein EP330_05780 [Deltaproteobacteria bacterium]
MSQAKTDSAKDAASVAAGSSWVFVATLGAHLLRFVTTRVLSQLFGPAVYGIYTSALTMVNLAGTVAAVGLDYGVVYFGSRHREARDDARLKGLLVTVLVLPAIAGAVLCAALYLRAGTDELGVAVRAVAPVVFALALLQVGRGILQLSKDMKAYAAVVQFGYPALLTAFTVGVALWTRALVPTLYAYVAAGTVAMVLALATGLRRFPILRQPEIRAQLALPEVVRFSLPQTLATMVRDLNQWADLLMLTWLAASTEVAIYRVALALAMVGRVPLAAVQAAFRPMVASVLAMGDTDRLQELLWTVTRWLVLSCAPLLLAMYLLPEAPLWLFDARYADGADVLSWLVVAEACVVASAPAIPVIVMSGRATLNLANGALALSINVALNYWLIPQYGAAGAAAANLVALALWSFLFAVQARMLVGVSTWSRPTLLLVAPTLVAAAIGSQVDGLVPRAGVVLGAWAVHLGIAWAQGLSEADRAFLDKIQAKFGRRRG